MARSRRARRSVRTRATPDFLEEVLKAERDARRVRARAMLTRTAGFPALKTLETYDFAFASCGTSNASRAAKPATELGWLSHSSSRRQRRASWSRLMRCSSGWRCRRWRQGVRSSCDGCDGCDGQVRTSVGSKVQRFCGLQPVRLSGCDGWCTPRVRRVRRQGRTRRRPKRQGFRGVRPIQSETECDGCDG